MRKVVITIVSVILVFALSGCGKSKPAKEVEDLISKIGEVTIDSKDSIVEAEEYYNTLTEKQKNEVEIYKTLVDARKAYDLLIAQEIANEVVDAIDDLKNKELYTLEELKEIRAQYEALDESTREYVTNYSELDSIMTTPTHLEQIAVNLVDGLMQELYNPSAMEIFSIAIQDGTNDSRFNCALVEMDYNGTNKLGGTVRKSGSYILWGKEAEYISLMSDCDASLEVYAEYLKLSTKMKKAVNVDPDRIIELLGHDK